mmetsp:Transcript_70774/g.207337  ORF Transcript_70774/g.207337 Transcript_70774/m.207337 type:complete len:302 (-) Transcript_70774:521-1426(-)
MLLAGSRQSRLECHCDRLRPDGHDLRNRAHLRRQPQPCGVPGPGPGGGAGVAQGPGLQRDAAAGRRERRLLLLGALRAEGRGGGAGARLHTGVRHGRRGHLQLRPVLRGLQLRGLEEEQSERRPEPVLCSGHRLCRCSCRLCDWDDLRRLREPCRIHRLGRLRPVADDRPRLALGLRGAPRRPPRGGPLPRGPPRGLPPPGPLGSLRAIAPDQVPERVPGHVRPGLHLRHQPHGLLPRPGVVHGRRPDVHDLLPGRRLGRPLQPRSHPGRGPLRPGQVLGARGPGLCLRAAHGRRLRGILL